MKRSAEFKKGQIVVLLSSGLNNQTIEKEIGRFKTVVNNFLNLNINNGKRNSGGRPKALPSRKEQ